MRDRKRLESLVANDEALVSRTGDIEAYFELAREGEDVLADLERDIKALSTLTEDLEAKTMLSGEADPLNAIVTVHPGAGGTESQDWAEMLLRMYLRWAEQQGFKTEMNDEQYGDEAGIKSATFTIQGEFAFGLLAGESGVHRLVRISPFDQAKRRCLALIGDYTCARIPLPWAAAMVDEIITGYGPDPYPYGIEASRPTLEAFCRYANDQGVTHRPMTVDDLFPPEVRATARV